MITLSYQGEAGDGDALTPQAIDDLKRKCREYCDDTDPLCVLNIGMISNYLTN